MSIIPNEFTSSIKSIFITSKELNNKYEVIKIEETLYEKHSIIQEEIVAKIKLKSDKFYEDFLLYKTNNREFVSDLKLEVAYSNENKSILDIDINSIDAEYAIIIVPMNKIKTKNKQIESNRFLRLLEV